MAGARVFCQKEPLTDLQICILSNSYFQRYKRLSNKIKTVQCARQIWQLKLSYLQIFMSILWANARREAKQVLVSDVS